MRYFLDGDNVYQENGSIIDLIGTKKKIDSERIDVHTVYEITYQFDMTSGKYVELSRASRAEPMPPLPPSPEEQIQQLIAENATLKQQVAQTNADAVAFQEFIFEKFPELA